MKSFFDGCAPEQGGMVREFEKNSVLKQTQSDEYRHHEQSKSFQNKFKKDIASLEEELRRYRNPFESKEFELIHLISNSVCDDTTVKAVKTVEQVGEQAKNSFMNMLQNNLSSFKDSITLNHHHVFHNSQTS